VKTLIKTAIVLGALAFGGKLAIERIADASRLDVARQRVGIVLAGLASGAKPDAYQTAVCMWWEGRTSLDQEHFNMAANLFDRWAKDLRERGPFEISASEIENAGESVLVHVTTAGKPIALRVIPGKPLERVE